MLPVDLVNKYNGHVGTVQPEESVLGQQLFRKLGVLKCSYKPARDGGAIGVATFKNSDNGLPASLPAGAVVMNAFVNVKAAPVGVGASLAVSIEAADDIVAAAAISGAPWSTLGLKQGVPDFATIADYKVTTMERTLTATISGAALTAGEIEAYLFYVL